jgi:hypothetical protein
MPYLLPSRSPHPRPIAIQQLATTTLARATGPDGEPLGQGQAW